jgi:hypothetical protein
MTAYRARSGRGTRTCVRATYRAVDAAGLRAISAAMHEWVNAEPALHAVATVDGHSLTLRSCDPGSSASAVGEDNSLAALRVAVTRVDVATALLQGGLSPSRAVCGAKHVVAELSPSQLLAQQATPAIRAAVGRAVAACG